ncbi:hypothetical protein [Aestuariimicrobium sp. T2.26MG-19.2B]|uniref:hypothetical protein n=1 Tax=Aestuariimicrobium sp. T2.26MG-19.2B TaxID=3040679 RepID=UPI0024778309|nr:hypothetical protein [Aestuariimicrobium sp. T2.26MG-19.2B]CAI9409312.1 hypothetical protein AESSP_02211 [Aestuariimicrobium sp. T2.26MG-19.2B]
MTAYSDRPSALDALLTLGPDMDAALDAVRRSALHADGQSAFLDRMTVRRALDEFTRGNLSEALLESWAEVLHGAEDVELDPIDRDFLAEALFELSTPELFGPMDEIVSNLEARERRMDVG